LPAPESPVITTRRILIVLSFLLAVLRRILLCYTLLHPVRIIRIFLSTPVFSLDSPNRTLYTVDEVTRVG
jgi:hypothetical protein